MHDLSLAGACMDELAVSDIDRGMVDLFTGIALEEQQIALFEVVDGIDSGPFVVVGVGICVPAPDLDAAS